MKFFITIMLIYFQLAVFGQNDFEKELTNNCKTDSCSQKLTQENNSFLYIDDTDLFVYFKGGNDGPSSDRLLQEFLTKNIIYPDSASKFGIEGKVIANFTITKTGRVTDISVISKTNSTLNKEVIRVLSVMPDWVWDKKIKAQKRKDVKRTLPIVFKNKINNLSPALH